MASWAGLGHSKKPRFPNLLPSVWRSGYARLGWPYVPFFPDASWPGFLYCLKYLGFGFVCVYRPIGVWHRFLMISKRSQSTLNQSNIEILARMRPGKMARMVTLHETNVMTACDNKVAYSSFTYNLKRTVSSWFPSLLATIICILHLCNTKQSVLKQNMSEGSSVEHERGSFQQRDCKATGFYKRDIQSQSKPCLCEKLISLPPAFRDSSVHEYKSKKCCNNTV